MRVRIQMPVASTRRIAVSKQYQLVKKAISGIEAPLVWSHYSWDSKTKSLDWIGYRSYHEYEKIGNPTYKFGNIYVAVI